ncbi:unnamed protein product [Nyctereutes procyonoides]|uniref:(raccoon dog) hypothetical protein n=1 Tax=Nyctereutes procyonoides TaxID=34880 RepID=A0A811YTG6_NYCPR|nr:unnamed protein product [Nyctereutes procyonoides]
MRCPLPVQASDLVTLEEVPLFQNFINRTKLISLTDLSQSCVYSGKQPNASLYLCFSGLYIAVIFPFRTTFAASQRFWTIVFHLHLSPWYFFIYPLISCLIHPLFSSMLFNFHVFVLFPDFFSCD